MACCYFIKTNSDNVVVEYHEYEGAPENFSPSPDHAKIAKPTLNPFGRFYVPTENPPFSADFAPGYEPGED